MDILKYIPFGEKNAVSRTSLVIRTGLPDRVIRSEIQKARERSVILNAQNGRGYFRPLREEGDKVRRWIAQERSRAESIFETVQSAEVRMCEYRQGGAN